MSRSNTNYWSRNGARLRFPKYSAKSYRSPAPSRVKRLWRRVIRAQYQVELVRHPDDPELFAYGKVFGKKLSDWY